MKITIKVAKYGVTILIDQLIFTELSSAPRYEERLDKKHLIAEVRDICDSHIDEVNNFLKDHENFKINHSLLSVLIDFHDKYGGKPKQLPDPPLPNIAGKVTRIYPADFIDWCKQFGFKIRGGIHKRSSKYRLYGQAEQLVKIFKKTKIPYFDIEIVADEIIIDYGKGVAKFHLTNHMGQLFASYITHNLEMERNNG